MKAPATAELPLLVARKLTGRFTGALGRLTLHQLFHNPHRVPLELVHLLPLPPQAAVVACRLRTAQRYVSCKLKERRLARQESGRQALQGKPSCLLEQDRPDLYTLTVGPIPPGGQLEVEITFDLILTRDGADLVLAFPVIAGRRYVPGRPTHGTPSGLGTGVDSDIVADASRLNPPIHRTGEGENVAFHLDVTIDSAKANVRSHTHELKTAQRKLQTRIQVDLTGSRRDFVLRVESPENRCRLTVDPKTSAFLLSATWTASAKVQRPLVLLLDRSYGMRGEPLTLATGIARRLLEALSSEQTFGLLGFAASPLHFRSELVAASPDNITAALAYLASCTANPGGELLQALAAVEFMVAGAAEVCDLVLLSSGEFADHDRLTSWATGQTSLQIHAVGLGPVVNDGLLQRLSSLGGGSSRRLEEADRELQVCDQLKRVLTAPRLSDLCLHGEPLVSASPEYWESSSAEPKQFHGRFRNTPERPIELVGTSKEGDEFSQTVEHQELVHTALESGWARARLLDLEDRWAELPVGTVDLAVGAKIVASEAATLLRQEAQRGKAWLERVQDFWRRKAWLVPRCDTGAPGLPVVKALEASSCMAYGPGSLSESSNLDLLERQAGELLEIETTLRELSLETDVLCRFTAFAATSGKTVPGTAHRVIVAVPPTDTSARRP